MSSDTFHKINALSEERRQLYELAGQQRLMPDQLARLDEINGWLPVLWDQYRRELVTGATASKPRVAPRIAQPKRDIVHWLPDTERQAA